MQPAVIDLSTSGGDDCLVYNYYVDVQLQSPGTCAPPPQGKHNNDTVISLLDLDNVNSGLSHTEAYSYDGVNRLTSAVATGSSTYNLTFAYDPYGNMSCQLNGSTSGLCPQYSFNQTNNEIMGYSYDKSGDLIGDGPHSYQYDGEGRLATIDNGSTLSNVYNALGLRVQSVWPGNNPGDFLYGPDGKWLGTSEFGVWGPPAVYLGSQLLAFEWRGSDEETYFPHNNVLGTMTIETDHSGGPADDVLFQPWGQIWNDAGLLDYQFAGTIWTDSYSASDFATYRLYRYNEGRWLTPDPNNAGADPANPQSWNAYAYALNNPTTLTDPEGTNVHVCVDTDNSSNSQNCFNLSDEQYANLVQQQNGQQGINLPTGNFPTGSITCGGQVCGTASYYEQGLEDQTANLLAFAGLAEGVARGAIALGEEGISALGRALGVGGEEAGSAAGIQTLNIGRFVTGQGLKRAIQTTEGPLEIEAQVEVRGTTIVLRNLSVAHPGGIEVVTSPGVGPLKAAVDALKNEFAADGFSRLIIQGLRITGADAPRYVNIPLTFK